MTGDTTIVGLTVRLPLAAGLTILVMWGLAAMAGRPLALPPARRGVQVVGSMIMNLTVVYPSAFAAWGPAGAGHLAFFDFGNGVLVIAFVI